MNRNEKMAIATIILDAISITLAVLSLLIEMHKKAEE